MSARGVQGHQCIEPEHSFQDASVVTILPLAYNRTIVLNSCDEPADGKRRDKEASHHAPCSTATLTGPGVYTHRSAYQETRAMALPAVLQKLALPVVASPMFIVSYPELVLAQCKAGIVGSFPALNARPAELLDEWLTRIQASLAEHKAAHPDAVIGPIAVNQIVHQSNTRLEHDVRVCVEHKVPIFITSLRAPAREIVGAVHSDGGLVLHDVINLRHPTKALEAGVDGLILVASGAGGHAGTTSPFALVGQGRRMFDGPIMLAHRIAHVGAILAAQAMGADLAYIGTRFIATKEAHAGQAY